MQRETGANRSTRVLVVASQFPPGHSGAGVDLERNYRLLLEKGMPLQITVLAQESPLVGDSQEPGLRVERCLRPWSKYRPFAVLVDFVRVVAHLLRSDVVHYNAIYPVGLFTIPLANLLRKRTVLQLHCMDGDDPETVRRSRRGRFLYRFYRQAQAFKTYSPAQTEALVKAGIARSRVFEVPPFVDSRIFQPPTLDGRAEVRQQYGIPEDSIVLSSIGRVGLRKGSDVLLDAFERLLAAGRDVYLLLAGPLEETGADCPRSLVERVETLSVNSGRIRLLGTVRDAVPVFQASDFFVLPSRAEGFGIVVIEAMASGAVVVLSQLEGIFDSIVTSGKDGHIVETLEGEVFAERLLRLFDAPQELERLRAAALQTARQSYSPQRVFDSLVQLLTPSMHRTANGVSHSPLPTQRVSSAPQ